MQLPGWETLAAEMTQHGYKIVYIAELECHQHGAFRGAIAGTDDMLPCPKCAQPAEAAILGRGLTRLPEIEWTCVSPALWPGYKTYREDAVPKRTPSRLGRRPCAKVYQRVRAEMVALEARAAPRKTRIFEAEAPKAKPLVRPRANQSEMAVRITVAAAMRMRGEGRIAIATTLGIDDGSLKVMLCRRKAALSAEQARLSALSADVRQSEEESARLQLGRNEPSPRVARRWQLRAAKRMTSDALEEKIGATAGS